ncbi:MAG: DUF4270 family protein [Paludibacteraceae bacterium]|nr:DUF4270 family protein [Paludibacteraceae bacterium]
MKYIQFLLGTILAAVLLVACKDDKVGTGKDILPEDDAIMVYLDTFRISSKLDSCGSLISTPDSFLVGEIETSYGVLRAEVLTQMAAPVGFRYPEGSVLDSICLYLYYRSSTGDPWSPMAIQVYEMDKATLDYDAVYMSDIDIDDYCSKDPSTLVTEHAEIVMVNEYTDSVEAGSTYIGSIRFKMNEDFCERFFAIDEFTSQEEFNEIFKGFYITSEFGSSTILNISTIGLGVYYHFPYQRWNPSTGEMEEVIEEDFKSFYANSEVKQVNRFEYMNEGSLLEELNQLTDVYNFVVSPAGVYTQLLLPFYTLIDTIVNHIGIENKRNIYVNMARLKVGVDYDPNKPESQQTRDDWLEPSPEMLLVLDSIREDFFRDKTLMVMTEYAILSDLLTGYDSIGNAFYYYSFDISQMLTAKLREETEDLLKDSVMVLTLVPVSTETNTTSSGSTTVTSIKQRQTPTATIIPSPTNPETPLILEVIYSGF